MVIVLDPAEVAELERWYALPSPNRVLSEPQARTFRAIFPQDLDEDELRVLIEADDMLAKPKRWTQRQAARTWLGTPVNPCSRLAYSVCAIGAVERAGHNTHRARVRLALNAMSTALYGVSPITSVNDELGYQPVREVFGKLRAYYNVGR